jgi:hypothetical protein
MCNERRICSYDIAIDIGPDLSNGLEIVAEGEAGIGSGAVTISSGTVWTN